MAQLDNILVIDSDEKNCGSICSILSENGYAAEFCVEGKAAIEKIKLNPFPLIISGLELPDISGLDLQQTIKELFPGAGFIAMTSHGSLESAVKALKNGALDYLSKPVGADTLLAAVKQGLEKLRQKKEPPGAKRETAGRGDTKDLLGNSPQMIEVYRTVAQISDSSANVLVIGETGTGKELIARALHINSARSDHPFIPVNCASIPEGLLESELFGHVKGAFTGAIVNKKGLFEEAAGGAIFLDEISDISLPIQAKLLRVLQDKEIRKVGDNIAIQINVRIIAATNKNLEEEVAAGRFREDLFYRLSVVTIPVPPLRDRTDEISFLAYHFLDLYAEEENPDAEDISNDAMEILEKYKWPGNVRELENVIERAVIICKGNQITPDDLPERITSTVPREEQPPEPGAVDFSFKIDGRVLSMAQVEKAYLQYVLGEAQGDKTKAAKMMGVGRRTLYRMMERHGVGPGARNSTIT